MATSRGILLRVGLALALLIAAGVLVFLIALAFLGLGTLFSHLFELTLFEATVVTLLGAVILTFLVPLIRALFFAPEGEEYEEVEEDWYDGDWEDWDDDDWDGDGQEADASFLGESSRRETGREEEIFPEVGRDDPCPCGSGRKFKYCHGRNRRE